MSPMANNSHFQANNYLHDYSIRGCYLKSIKGNQERVAYTGATHEQRMVEHLHEQ